MSAKKIILALPFLTTFIIFCLTLVSIFQDPTLIVSLDGSAFQSILLMTIACVLASFFFVVFATLGQKWRLVLLVFPAVFLTASLFIPFASIIFALLSLGALSLVYLFLQIRLNTYTAFQPQELLIPSIAQLTTFFLLAASCSFYFASEVYIKQHGFQLPNSLIDATLQTIPPEVFSDQSGLSQSISPQQLQMLKNSPELRQQLNINEAALDELSKAENPSSSEALIKASVKTQMQTFFNPYLSILPIILTALFFLSCKSLAAIISFLLHPLIWATFRLLEQAKITSYVTETREVKKLVVAE